MFRIPGTTETTYSGVAGIYSRLLSTGGWGFDGAFGLLSLFNVYACASISMIPVHVLVRFMLIRLNVEVGMAME
jgi:hypothetical protein